MGTELDKKSKIKTPLLWRVPYSVFFIMFVAILVLAAMLSLFIISLKQENVEFIKEITQIKTSLDNLLNIDPTQQSIEVSIMPIDKNEDSPVALTEALSIMQNQYDGYMSNLTLMLTVFAIIITLFTFGMPILSYAFLQKDQVDSLKSTSKDIKDDFEKITLKFNDDILRVNEALSTYEEKTAEINEEIQRVNKAIEELQKVTQKTANPDDKTVLEPISSRPEDIATNYRLRAYFENDTKKKIEYLTTAIELVHDFTDAYIDRGNCFYGLKQYEKAIADYDEVIRINRNSSVAYFNRGNSYASLKQYERAIADYDEAIRIDPNYSRAYVNRGNTYNLLRQYKKAIADFDKAITINPDSSVAYNDRGISYNHLKQHEKAITDYDEAIRIDPNYSKAYNNRGVSYYKLGLYDMAFIDYSNALDLDENNSYVLANMGEYYNKMNRFQDALTNLNKAIEINSTEAEFYFHRAVSYKALEDYDKALSDCNSALLLEIDDDELEEKILALKKELEEHLESDESTK